MRLKLLRNISMNQRESKMRLIKRVLVFVLTVCMVVTCIPPASVSAAASDDVRAGIIAEKKANDGIKGRLEGNVPAEFYGGKVDKSITVKAHNPRFNEWKKEKGIDVSHHQGVIDWDKVAADGIKFAFVRVAGRGYGSAGNLFEDSLYKTNLKEAKAIFCKECGKCEEACPQHIEIRKDLKRVAAQLEA